jgi:hypothetical protein
MQETSFVGESEVKRQRIDAKTLIYVKRLGPERLTRYYAKHLERLGHEFTLEISVAA